MDEIRSDQKELLRKMEKLEERVTKTETAITTAKIGWRVVWGVGSFVVMVAGAIGAAIAKWLPILGGFPK